MASAGLDGMANVLVEVFSELGTPQTKNEVSYFWAALFNAARTNNLVWTWLCTRPHIRKFAPPKAKFHTVPQLAGNIPLPAIGGPDDEPYQPSERQKQYSAEPTEANFRKQAAVLDALLQAEEGEIKNIREYVASFYYSGTGKIVAQTQLMEAGFHALATRQGIDYLMKTYPPE